MNHDAGKDPAAYHERLLNTEIIEVTAYREDLAAIIGKLKFDEGSGSDPYSCRVFGQINGIWKNLGEDRLPSLEAARENFNQKKDGMWEGYVKARGDIKSGKPLYAGGASAKRSAAIAPGEPQGISVEKADLMGRVEWAMMHGGRDITARKTIEWGDVEKDASGNRKLRYKFYATIWDKDVYIVNRVFTFDAKGNVLDMEDVEGFPQKKVVKPADVSSQAGMKDLVEEFFSKNFRDITSRETIEWGEVTKAENGNSSIRYKYRARIWDKDTKIMNQVFTFDPKGNFVSVKNVEGFPAPAGESNDVPKKTSSGKQLTQLTGQSATAVPAKPGTALTSTPSENRKAKSAGTISGRVLREDTGQPLAGAVVRAAVPAADMCFLRTRSDRPWYETKTTDNGQYQLVVPVNAANSSVSLDAFSPGFRSAAGLYMTGDQSSKIALSSNGTASCDFRLKEATYVAGTLVNEKGEPVDGAMVSATLQFAKANAGVTRVLTDKHGVFQVFDYPTKQPKDSEGLLIFTHPKYYTVVIKDIYALTAEQRRNLRLVMTKGRTIKGQLQDADGKPVANVMVDVDFAKERKATISGQDGSYGLYGLPEGECTIIAHDLKARQKVRQRLLLSKDLDDWVLKLSRIETARKRPITVLGMKLVDMTAPLRDEYDLYGDGGAIVLDPGANQSRLKIGRLVEGDRFWMVGETCISSVEEFVMQILRNVKRRPDGSGSCRVVYDLRRVDIRGTNTQYLELRAEDLRELEALAKQFATKNP